MMEIKKPKITFEENESKNYAKFSPGEAQNFTAGLPTMKKADFSVYLNKFFNVATFKKVNFATYIFKICKLS